MSIYQTAANNCLYISLYALVTTQLFEHYYLIKIIILPPKLQSYSSHFQTNILLLAHLFYYTYFFLISTSPSVFASLRSKLYSKHSFSSDHSNVATVVTMAYRVVVNIKCQSTKLRYLEMNLADSEVSLNVSNHNYHYVISITSLLIKTIL